MERFLQGTNDAPSRLDITLLNMDVELDGKVVIKQNQFVDEELR